MEIFVIKQNLRLANGMNEWVDIDCHTVESLAWKSFDKYKATGFDIAIIKRTETDISKLYRMA